MSLTTSIATVSLSGLLEEKIDAIAAAGFDAVEIFEQDLLSSPLAPADIRRRCEELGLVVSLYQPFRDFEGVAPEDFRRSLARVDAKLEVAAELGAPLMLLCSNVATATVDDDGLVAEQLHAGGELAERWGVKLAYEALAWGRFVSDYAHAWRLAAAADHPAVGTCLDSFHILSRGSSLDEIAQLPADRLFFCQLADAHRLDLDVLSWSRHHRLFPGQGDWDLADFTSRLLDAGYAGPLSIEVFNDTFRQTDPARTAIDAARSLRYLGDEVARRGSADRAEVLPDPGPPLGVDFVELSCADDAPLGHLFRALGFEDRGKHRRKPVNLWSAGTARVVVNHAMRESAPALSALGVTVKDAVVAGRRAEGLLVESIERSTLPDEELLMGFQAPDGSGTYFATAGEHREPAWVSEFSGAAGSEGNLVGIDHVTLSEPWDSFDEAVLYYRAVLGLEPEPSVDVPDPSGLVLSQILQTPDLAVRLVLNCFPPGRPVQGHATSTHVAFRCRDLVALIARLNKSGIGLLDIPNNYYNDLEARYVFRPGELELLASNNVLYDRQGDAEFLHAYLLPAGDFFIELVERRKGYDGFGAPDASIRRAAQTRAAMLRPRTAA